MTNAFINDAGIQFARQHLSLFPRPDRAAHDALKQWASNRGVALDPDQTDVVTFHYQPSADRVHIDGVITAKSTLTQAMLSNWQGESNNNLIGGLFGEPWAGHLPGLITVVDALRPPAWNAAGANYQVFNGVFRRTVPQVYGPQTLLGLPAEDLQRFIWNMDFHSAYKSMLDRYWTEARHSHQTLAKMAFIAACNKQVSEGSLDDTGRQLAWQAAGLLPRSANFGMRVLNVYGYSATDLVFMYDKKMLNALLYVPGNDSPFHTVAGPAGLKDWVAEQCKDPVKRTALAEHFALADRPDGLDFSGLHTALEGLAVYPAVYRLSPNRPGFTTNGVWSPRTYVNYRADKYSPAITGDLFQALTDRQRARSYQDADTLITDDSEVSKGRWRGYFNSALSLLGPLAIVLPELAPLFAVGGIAQFGLGLDAAINAKGVDQQAAGAGEASFGVLNALPLLIAGAAKAPALYRFKSEGFLAPREVNGQLGYPLSPMDPPVLPADQALEYFQLPDPVAPLEGADQATRDAIIRLTRFNGEPDTLTGVIAGYTADMLYDVQADAFIQRGDRNAVNPTLYRGQVGSRNLVRVPEGRAVTDQMRTASLRALGVDLPLPVTVPEFPLQASSTIPEQILSIWVGDRAIPDNLLANLAKNSQTVAGSRFSLRLYLSNESPVAYARNLQRLAQHAPNVRVLTLEEQPFYAQFRESANYPQYRAAIDGNGGIGRNFSSAADVLRFPLLNHEGGLYMDIDDRLLAEGEHAVTINGRNYGPPAKALDATSLQSTPDGLLLYPPIANERMNIHCIYNTSLIGSHANNPTLLAISEEMHARFQANPDFYNSKPDPMLDPVGFARYANTLSRLTGPTLLTDMTDRLLPDLKTIRQITNLDSLSTINAEQFIDRAAYKAAMERYLPLNGIAKIGSNHSWAKP
ncbi:dermonecrotic toxin domain-containing protein [Pseudomonas promysalinigenes]|uniref:dermonecrotic toxin domain-containing protein n=1 Tax=Pseudomonas promysalinigenes TaxID=485898 RepID=UPI00164807A9|nr:DUF6543 domain-containing protein [Pseudomonas promysalinigenes]QXI32484.1 mannosyltransferase [Pseudomonas promysalinigenes]